LDESGRLHVFMAQKPLRRDVAGGQSIEHLALINDRFERLPPVASEHAPVDDLTAVTSKTGEIQLAWVEAGYYAPQFHDSAIYVQPYRDGAWGPRISVLDENVSVGLTFDNAVSVMTQDDGSLDVYWLDYREHHVVSSILTMGEGGEFAKVYHRRHTGAGWSAVERVQPHGITEPVTWRVLRNGEGPPDVLWSRGLGSDSSVVRTVWSGKKWIEKERLAKCHSPIGGSGIAWMAADTDAASAFRLAWTCSGYERIDAAGASNDSFSELFVSVLVDGAWKAGPEISHYAAGSRWLWGGKERSLLLLQEQHTRQYPAPPPSPVPLLVKTIEQNRCVGTEVLADRSVAGYIAAIANSDGTIHVLYAEPTSPADAMMKYRRGKYARG
jgi:hypothetical protein